MLENIIELLGQITEIMVDEFKDGIGAMLYSCAILFGLYILGAFDVANMFETIEIALLVHVSILLYKDNSLSRKVIRILKEVRES